MRRLGVCKFWLAIQGFGDGASGHRLARVVHRNVSGLGALFLNGGLQLLLTHGLTVGSDSVNVSSVSARQPYT